MSRSIHDYRIGCQPSPSVPAETVLADGWLTFLAFYAVSETVGSNGTLEDKGVAVLECVSCSMSKFGYPNDEGLPEHSLYDLGLGQRHPIVEVRNSPWAEEVAGQLRASARRIWGNRGHDPEKRGAELKHFIVLLKEATFECVATELKVAHYARNWAEAYSYAQSGFQAH